MGLCVVIAGNPLAGLTIYGPFNNQEEASDAASLSGHDEWWIAPLEKMED